MTTAIKKTPPKMMTKTATKFYTWQNGMCISYLLRFNQIQNFLLANGWELVNDPGQAEYTIIGACGAFMPNFTRYADEINNMVKLNTKIVVYGCLPIIDRQFFSDNTARYDLFVPARKPEQIEQIIESPVTPWNKIPVPGRFRKQDYRHYNPKHQYIMIQEGCTQKCLFCPHKLAIGVRKSRPLGEIISQVKRCVADGAELLVLEGNDGGAWGIDLESPQTYKDLLVEIYKVLEDCKIRIGNFAPKWTKDYGDALIDPRITDIKIPIQSASARLLSLVGRDPYVREMGPFLKKLRHQNKDIYLRTEIIVGLPTSTEEELMETLDFVAEHFDKVACYSFDLHPSSKIAKQNLPFYEDDIVEKRFRMAVNFLKDKPHVWCDISPDGGRICGKVISEDHLDNLEPPFN